MKSVKSSLLIVTALGLTLFINLLIFFGIPFLSAATASKHEEVYDSFVSFKMTKPVIQERKKEDRKPEEEKKPEKMPKMKLRSKPHAVTKPKMNMSLPKMQFAMNSRLAEGMEISMPETDIQGGLADAGGVKIEFEIGEVDTKPRVVFKTNPVYPYSAKRRHITGRVVLRFMVDKSGQVSKMKVVKSEPKGVFDKAVTDCLSRWKFKPGIYDGKPVNTWVVAPFDFRM